MDSLAKDKSVTRAVGWDISLETAEDQALEVDSQPEEGLRPALGLRRTPTARQSSASECEQRAPSSE